MRILDYKPEAKNNTQTEKLLSLYAMALGERTSIPVSNITCTYFDENGYYEFIPIQ